MYIFVSFVCVCCSAKADKFREILTSLMLQRGSLPLVLPSLRDLVSKSVEYIIMMEHFMCVMEVSVGSLRNFQNVVIDKKL
jgi:hypothetical protein